MVPIGGRNMVAYMLSIVTWQSPKDAKNIHVTQVKLIRQEKKLQIWKNLKNRIQLTIFPKKTDCSLSKRQDWTIWRKGFSVKEVWPVIDLRFLRKNRPISHMRILPNKHLFL